MVDKYINFIISNPKFFLWMLLVEMIALFAGLIFTNIYLGITQKTVKKLTARIAELEKKSEKS